MRRHETYLTLAAILACAYWCALVIVPMILLAN